MRLDTYTRASIALFAAIAATLGTLTLPWPWWPAPTVVMIAAALFGPAWINDADGAQP